MTNQGESVRQAASVSMAFGLIASLLPGLAAAQDLSTRESLEKDWEWVREQPREWQWLTQTGPEKEVRWGTVE